MNLYKVQEETSIFILRRTKENGPHSFTMAFTIERHDAEEDRYMSLHACNSLVISMISENCEKFQINSIDDLEKAQMYIAKVSARGRANVIERNILGYIGSSSFDSGIVVSKKDGLYAPIFYPGWEKYYLVLT